MPELNGYICTGLVVEDDWNGSISKMDPDDLRIDKSSDYGGADAKEVLQKYATDRPATFDESVAACRDWYDAMEWGKAFCCQMFGSDDTWRTFVVDATSVTAQDGMEGGSFGAEAFNEACNMAATSFAVLLMAVTLY